MAYKLKRVIIFHEHCQYNNQVKTRRVYRLYNMNSCAPFIPLQSQSSYFVELEPWQVVWCVMHLVSEGLGFCRLCGVSFRAYVSEWYAEKEFYSKILQILAVLQILSDFVLASKIHNFASLKITTIYGQTLIICNVIYFVILCYSVHLSLCNDVKKYSSIGVRVVQLDKQGIIAFFARRKLFHFLTWKWCVLIKGNCMKI